MRRMSLNFLFFMLLFGVCSQAIGQIIIKEITTAGQIEIENIGMDTVDLDPYWLCNRPQYARVGALNVECGSVNLFPGEQVTVSATTINFSGEGDELGLFVNSQFSDPSSIVDYVIWGERSGVTRESIAVDGGVWSSGDRAPVFSDSLSLNYDGEGDAASDYATADLSICDNMTIDSCMVSGGAIQEASGLSELTFCDKDSAAASVNVVSDSAVGTFKSWVITDTSGTIIDLPIAPPFDFSEKRSATCFVQQISYEEGLMGAAIGENINALSGCFALSNSIQVNTLDSLTCSGELCEANGGQILVLDSLTELTICIDDEIVDTITIALTENEGSNSAWIVSDTAMNILSFGSGNTFNLDSAGIGACLFIHISYEDDITGLAVDSNLMNIGGCHSLSNTILVHRLSGEDCLEASMCDLPALTSMTVSGAMDTSLCGPADMLSIELELGYEGELPAESVTGEIITDDKGIILSFSYSDDTISVVQPEDFEDFVQGFKGKAFHQRGLVFTGQLNNLEIGNSLDSLEGCYTLSNIFTFNFSNFQASEISVGGLSDISICVDDDIDETLVINSSGDSSSQKTWLVTDTAGLILAVLDSNFFDLEPAGIGVCRIWEVAHDGSLEGAVVDSNAANLSGCIAISNAVTVTRLGGEDCPEECPVSGGTLTIADGGTELEICAGDGISDAFDVVLEGEMGSNSAWIIADDEGNILAFPLSPPFDFEGASAGVAYVYNLTYENGLSGASLGGNVNNLEGCFSLSNPIIVTRQFVSGGDLSLASGGEEISYCDDGSEFTAFDVILNNAVGGDMRWVLTDADGIIISFPLGSPFDLDGTQAGSNLLYNVSYREDASGVEIGTDITDLTGCFSISNPIEIIRNEVIGGSLTAPNGSSEVTVCAGDGRSDAFKVRLDGASGPNSLYIVTDTNQVILDVSESGNFDFEEAGAGVCLVWHLSYAGDLTGFDVDSSATNISGCFELSNFITIIRVSGDDCPEPCLADGGIATMPNGGSSIDICSDDQLSDLLTFSVSGNSGPNDAWIVTDQEGNILGLPEDTSIDLEGAGAGVSLIRSISYDDDVVIPEIGGNIDELFGCFGLSTPITVNRLTGDDCMSVCVVAKSTISTQDGDTALSLCVDDGVRDSITVVASGGTGTENTYIIADADNRIVNIAMGGSYNFEGSGSGTSLLYHISSVGTLSGVALGGHTQDISGCFGLSNAITVTKLIGEECINLCDTDGGDIMYVDGSNEMEFCSGDVLFDISHTSEADPELDYFYILTDAQDNIVEVRNSDDGGSYDMNTSSQGVSHIWGWSTDGSIEPEIGASISTLEGDCNKLSGDFVNVSRVSGGLCDVGCHAPRDVRIRSTNNGRFTVKWDKVVEAIGYEMEIGFEGFPESFAIIPLSRKKVTISAPDDRVVLIRVRAICADGEKSPYTRDYFITPEVNIVGGATLRSIDKIKVSEILVTEQEPLFPNPAGQYINVWYDGEGVEGQMAIFSRDGREVLKSTLPGDSEYREIDIQVLPSGMYFMMIRSNGEMWMREKFVKSDQY